MTNLVVYFCTFPVSSVDVQTRNNVVARIGADFCKCYGTSGKEVTVILQNGESANWDIAIAYDHLPQVMGAVSSRLNKFRDMVADELFSIFPSVLGYKGKVTVRNINTIVDAAPVENMKKDINNVNHQKEEDDDADASYEQMAKQFQSEKPKFTFNQLVLEPDVQERLMEAVSVLENREKLFEEWNLKAIMSPSVLLNLYGAPGTGKTMTAEALADRLGKNIIRTTYADIESKYHGEGPKRLKAIFLAAKQQDAVLFIDEADSMLSARLTNVSDGSAQAINSMRSQLLISLENHDGVVIFATNLIENYDKAFLTRLICLELKRPTKEAKEAIWFNHLYPKGNDEKTLRIPLAHDIDLGVLSEYDFCGRDIRNAVKQACIGTVVKGKQVVDQEELIRACERIAFELKSIAAAANQNQELKIQSMSGEEKKKLIDNVVENLKKKNEAEVK